MPRASFSTAPGRRIGRRSRYRSRRRSRISGPKRSRKRCLGGGRSTDLKKKGAAGNSRRFLLPFAGYHHGKRRALARLAFDLDRASEQLGERLDDVKPHSHTAVKPGFRAVYLLEFVEDHREGLLGNSDPGVGHLELHNTGREA